MGYSEVELETAMTNMRTLLNYELNAEMEVQEGATWDTDYVQDIYFRQSKLNVACQSEHVKVVTEKVSLFFENLQEHLSEQDLTTVCGIHNYTPYKTPKVECIRNYCKTGMRQVELTNSAPADINMSLLQQLITKQNLFTFTGPTQPATFKRAPKATYHARGREPVELDESNTATATFWAECSPPTQPTKTGVSDRYNNYLLTATLPTQAASVQPSQYSKANLKIDQNQTSMTTEIISFP